MKCRYTLFRKTFVGYLRFWENECLFFLNDAVLYLNYRCEMYRLFKRLSMKAQVYLVYNLFIY